MTPEWKRFLNFFPKSAFQPRFTCYGQIWRKSAVVKLPKSSHIADKKKIPGVGDTFEPPFRPRLVDRAQNFVNVVGLDLCMCTDFGPDRLRFAELIPERVQKGESAMQAFSLQKVKQYRLSAYNYRVRQCVMKGRI